MNGRRDIQTILHQRINQAYDSVKALARDLAKIATSSNFARHKTASDLTEAAELATIGHSLLLS